MNYSELTDFEINKLVAERLGLNYALMAIGREDHAIIINENANEFKQVDYCNNPSDAWPIILEYGINITNYHHSDGLWYASNYYYEDNMIEINGIECIDDFMESPGNTRMDGPCFCECPTSTVWYLHFEYSKGELILNSVSMNFNKST